MGMGRLFSISHRSCQCLMMAFVFAVALATTAHAQYRASVQGTVADSGGAVVSDATVTLTNKETGRVQETKTSAEGFYRFSGLGPGNYSLSAELTGFKKTILDLVVAAEETQGVDLALEVGAVSEVVEVTSDDVPALRTEDGQLGGTLSEKEIQRLPQVGRDPFELVRLAPGVFGNGARSGTGDATNLPNSQGPGGSNNQIYSTENRPPVTAAGQRVEANNIQIDGVNAMSQAWGGAAVVTPNQESVKEIRVLANNYSAEFGRNTGAQIQVVSQTGTNDWHGSLFVKRNTPGLSTTQDFERQGTAIREDPQKVNRFLTQWGGSVGGPIIKNKLFFFFAYERVGQSSSRFEGQWVETQAFDDAILSAGGPLARAIVGFPGMVPPGIAGGDFRDCAAAGYTQGVDCRVVNGGLDLGSIDRSAPLGQMIADPLGGGFDGIADVQFAQLLIPSENTAQQFNLRVDYQVTDKDLVAFSMYVVPNKSTFNDAFQEARPGLLFVSDRRNMVGTLLYTRTLSDTMINEARFNVTRWYFNEVESNPNIGYGIPGINIPNRSAFVRYGTSIGPGVFYQTSYNFRDTLTKVVNSHVLKFGGDIIREQNNDKAPWAGRPTYEFGSLWNFANDAPTNESAFFDPATGSFAELAAYARAEYYSLFAQDDWKVKPNLTVNLGLRWEYFTPLRSKNDRISNLLLGPDGSLDGARVQVGGNLYESDKNNFGPQIGFAWSPAKIFGHDVENKAVIRGGFGVGFNRLPGSRLFENRFNPPFFASYFLTGDQINYALPSDLNSLGYPANPNATTTFDPSTGLPITGPSVGFNAVSPELPNGYAYRYSLETEYDLGANWIATLSYQGSQGKKLPRLIPYQLFVAPNPRINNVNLTVADAYSNFNALLVGAQHRFSNGYTFLTEYRWAKSLDTCSNDQNCNATYPFDQRQEYGPSDYDVRHAFKAAAVWEIPFLRGRSDLVGKLAGGWEVSGIVTANSGFPWTPVVGGGECASVVAGGGVCPLRPIGTLMGPATDSTSNDTLLGQGQFPGGGLDYFIPPPAGSFTTPPLPGVGRNYLRGPGYFNVDTTVVKRFGLPDFAFLGESAGIELRMNVYNLFNTLNLEPFRVKDDNTQIQHPDFGRALHVLQGRVIEFQARFSF